MPDPSPNALATNAADPRHTPGAAAATRYRVAERVLDRSASIARRAFAALVAIAEGGRRRPGRNRRSEVAPAAAAGHSAGRGELGVAAPPSAAGFAAVHLGAGASEAAGMQKLAAAEAAMPALAAALAEVPLSRHVLQQLARKARPATADAWAARIRALDHAALRRLAECAEDGQSPDTIDVRVGEITDGPLPPLAVGTPAVPGGVTQDSAGATGSEQRPTRALTGPGAGVGAPAPAEVPAERATQDSPGGCLGGRRAAPEEVRSVPADAMARDPIPGGDAAGAGPSVPGAAQAAPAASLNAERSTLNGPGSAEPQRWRFATSAAFSALDFEAFERAWKHIGAADHKTYRPIEAIAAMVRRLRTKGLRPDDVVEWRATRPFRLWLVDRVTRAVWLETSRGALTVPHETLPAPPPNARWRCRRDLAQADGPDGRAVLAVRVQSEGGPWVPLTPTALADAAPELRAAPEPPRAARRAAPHLPGDGALLPPDAAAGSRHADSRSESLLDYCVDILGPPRDATAAELRELAPSAHRVDTAATHAACHALADAADARLVRIREDGVTVDGHPARLSAADARDRIRVGRALRSLPWIDAAFAAGVLSYSKVRALVRVATPATEARWAVVARRSSVEAVEALVAAAKPGEPPPRVPRDRLPLWPAGRIQRRSLYGCVEGADASDLAAWRARLDALAGRPLDTGESLGALAGIYLRTFDRRRRRHLVVYTLGPETRAAANRAAQVRPEARGADPEPEAQLQAVFPLLAPVWDRMTRRDRRGGAARAPDRRLGIRPTGSMRDAMHARDGVRCRTPFCPHGLVIHWGHLGHACDGDPADLATDYPPCGPCNNAVEAGELRITRDADGRLVVTDGAGNPITPRRRLGVHLDRALLARLWTRACRQLGVDEAECPMPFETPARSARRPAGSSHARAGAPLGGGASLPPPLSVPDARSATGIREATPATQDSGARGRPPTYHASG